MNTTTHSKRRQVFERIFTERNYQDEKWGPPDRHLGFWLLAMQRSLEKCGHALLYEGEGATVEEVLQLAAIAVACLEQHGEGK